MLSSQINKINCPLQVQSAITYFDSISFQNCIIISRLKFIYEHIRPGHNVFKSKLNNLLEQIFKRFERFIFLLYNLLKFNIQVNFNQIT